MAFDDAFSTSGYTAPNYWMNNELERMWKEGSAPKYELVFQYLPGMTKEFHGEPIKVVDFGAKI
jgi:hypothetical protein